MESAHCEANDSKRCNVLTINFINFGMKFAQLKVFFGGEGNLYDMSVQMPQFADN